MTVKPLRQTVVISAMTIAVSGALAACTDDSSTPDATGSHVSPAPSSSANTLIDPVEFWGRNPDQVPPDFDGANLLINEKLTGPRDVSLPSGTGSSGRLILAVTCAESAEYRLQLKDAQGQLGSYTGGDDCGSGAVISYETPAFSETAVPTTLTTDLPSGIEYFVTVYGVPR